MKIAVCLKQVPDTAARIKLNDAQTGIDESALSYVLNPYDEYALEEAIKLKEEMPEIKVAVFMCETRNAQQNLRKALAMGADEAVLINRSLSDAFQTAQVLIEAIKQHFNGLPDLICCGKEATDSNRGEVGAMIAELLGWPVSTSVVGFELQDHSAKLVCESDGGNVLIAAPLPFVFTAQKGLNTPRPTNMKAVMLAKKKPIHTYEPENEEPALIKLLGYEYPPQKSPGKILASADELVEALIHEAKAL